MERLVITLILCWMGICSFAEECYIPIAIEIEDAGSSQELKSVEATLRRAFSTGNLTAAEGAQFKAVISPEEISSDVITGLRPTYTVVMELYLTVSNVVTKEQFASTAIRISGSGKTVSDARKSAARSIKPGNRKIEEFVRESRRNILNYYDENLDVILNQVRKTMGLRDLERSMWMLSSIPPCIRRYGEVADLSSEIFDRYLTLDCSVKLRNANAAWAAAPDIDGARLALSYLAGIDAESSCNPEAKKLMSEIKEVVGQLYGRDRDKADDLIEFEKEMMRATIDNEQARIEAMRAIGVAYGENQVKSDNIINNFPK